MAGVWAALESAGVGWMWLSNWAYIIPHNLGGFGFECRGWGELIGAGCGHGLCRRGVHPLCWRDIFDIAVRWRQISEPNDAVWWIDRLLPEVRVRATLQSYVWCRRLGLRLGCPRLCCSNHQASRHSYCVDVASHGSPSGTDLAYRRLWSTGSSRSSATTPTSSGEAHRHLPPQSPRTEHFC
jgi:hypothetical protein